MAFLGQYSFPWSFWSCWDRCHCPTLPAGSSPASSPAYPWASWQIQLTCPRCVSSTTRSSSICFWASRPATSWSELSSRCSSLQVHGDVLSSSSRCWRVEFRDYNSSLYYFCICLYWCVIAELIDSIMGTQSWTSSISHPSGPATSTSLAPWSRFRRLCTCRLLLARPLE